MRLCCQIPRGRTVGRSAPELNIFLRQRRSLLWEGGQNGGGKAPSPRGGADPVPDWLQEEEEEEWECSRWDPEKLDLQVGLQKVVKPLLRRSTTGKCLNSPPEYLRTPKINLICRWRSSAWRTPGRRPRC